MATNPNTGARRRDVLAFFCGLPVKGTDLRSLMRAGLVSPYRCEQCGRTDVDPFLTCPACVPADVLVVCVGAPAPPPAVVAGPVLRADVQRPRVLPPALTPEGELLAYRVLAEGAGLVARVRDAACSEMERRQQAILRTRAPAVPAPLLDYCRVPAAGPAAQALPADAAPRVLAGPTPEGHR